MCLSIFELWKAASIKRSLCNAFFIVEILEYIDKQNCLNEIFPHSRHYGCDAFNSRIVAILLCARLPRRGSYHIYFFLFWVGGHAHGMRSSQARDQTFTTAATEPQQQQHQILNLIGHQGTPMYTFMKRVFT